MTSQLRSKADAVKADVAPAVGTQSFEQSLNELEALIAKLERGDLSLDETVSNFANGMALYETCRQSLEQAQLRVELLLKGASDLATRSPIVPR